MLGGRGYDQDLLRRQLLTDLFFFGKEGNEFLSEALAGGNVFSNKDRDRLDLSVFTRFVLNVIIVNLLKLLILIPR